MPLLSIIVTSKNTEEYIVEALKSILCQENYSPEKIEVIVVDDCSTDHTLKVLKNMRQRWNFNIIQNKYSCGLGSSRNIGLKSATGTYVAYLDGDDYISSNYLTTLFPYLEENNYDLLVFNYYRFYSENNEIYETSNVGLEIHNQYTASWNKVVKREIALKSLFLEDNIKWEDVYYTIVLNMNCKNITLLTENLYFYRRRLGSLSYDYNDIDGHNDIVVVFNKLVSKYSISVLRKNKGLRKLLNKQFFTHAVLAISPNSYNVSARNIVNNILYSFRVLNKNKIPVYGNGFVRFIKNNLIIILLHIKMYVLVNKLLRLIH